MQPTFITLEDELKKYPDAKKDELQPFREWLDKQPHLPVPISDAELFRFWHSTHFRLEPAKAALDTYFTVRTMAPELFTDRLPGSKDYKHSFQATEFVMIPERATDGSVVSALRFANSDSSLYFWTASTKMWCSMVELWQAREGAADGFIILVDFTNVTLGHLTRVNLPSMAKFFVYLQEGMPVRLKAMYFVNIPSFMDQIMAIMRPFMKKELLSMVHLHKSPKELEKIMPKKAIPDILGGEAPWKEMYKHTLDAYAAYKDYTLEQETRLVVEARRPGRAKTAGDMFGMEGSFKKLELD